MATQGGYVIELRGPVPAKKNLWRRGRGQKTYLPRSRQAEIDSLVFQAVAAWRKRAPLTHPSMDVQFHTRSRRPDRDNMLSTLLDVLVKSRVIENDNIARFNGPVVIQPAVVGEVEKTIVILEAV